MEPGARFRSAKGSQFMTSADCLARTISLFETDFAIADRELILRALLQPRIVIVADERVVRSLAGQVAISTAAMLMARTGHHVFIDTPDAVVIGHQPPLGHGSFHEALFEFGTKLVAGITITIGPPVGSADIVFCLGNDLPWMAAPSARYISVGASDWAAGFSEMRRRQPWSASDWPIGAAGAAVLMAAEAIKISARVLAPHSPNWDGLRGQFLDSPRASLKLLPPDTPLVRDLGEFDIVSAGAVSNAFLYSILRIPGLAGSARALDGDVSDSSNLNRNALLTTGWVGEPKVDLFKAVGTPNFHVEPVPLHYPLDGSVLLRDHVVVGVDDIPARWALARLGVPWMGVGATTHVASMASVHFGHAACAACLHPNDEQIEGPTPTIAFSSFLAGLMMAADLLYERSGRDASLVSRERFICALRSEEPWSASVPPIAECPAECPASRLRRAG